MLILQRAKRYIHSPQNRTIWIVMMLLRPPIRPSAPVSASRARTPATDVSWKTVIRPTHPVSPPAPSSNPERGTHRVHAPRFQNSYSPSTQTRMENAQCGPTVRAAVPWTWSSAATANPSPAKRAKTGRANQNRAPPRFSRFSDPNTAHPLTRPSPLSLFIPPLPSTHNTRQYSTSPRLVKFSPLFFRHVRQYPD
ncbi:hypothetical protein M408DRAFT_242203 [Serendipita vermifera MAFF 305830]|uniref:Uncharacterized protein n=1 Tax=Serendipita vermifera MAFF 305830 TaxID=933852 RepID=A0A0C3BKM1_SERVB|nr:hypothetical protein M408DRAFT_242203 [Serendipita vermifera MAFF 305830]